MNNSEIPPMSRAEKITGAGCFVLILIHLVASYFPDQRLWGIDLLHYLPATWRYILVILGLSVLVPLVNRLWGDLLDALSNPIRSGFNKISKYYGYVFIGLSAGVLFWAFRVRTFFLGDGSLRANEINRGAEFSVSAPLDFLVHAKLTKLLGWDAFGAYAALSVLSGALFVFLILLLADRIGERSSEKALIFLVIITMGANLLFFGYVESYTLVYAAMIAYLLFALGYLMERNGLASPVILFLLAVSLHVSALVLLPSLLYVMLSRRPREAAIFRLLLSIGVVLLVGGGLLLLRIYGPEQEGLGYYLISPLGGGESSYSLFSSAHLVDFINHQLLISPAGILICAASILGFPGKMNLKDKVVRFLLVVSACTLAYALVVDPKLGYARDWDLFALTGFGYTLLGLYLLINRWRQTRVGHLRYISLSLFFTSLVLTLPWIYVNASESKAVNRFEHIMDLDRERSADGREKLAMHYGKQGNLDREIAQWKEAISVSNNPRHITNLAVTYLNLRRYDLAMIELEKSLAVDSTFDFTHFCMGEIFSLQGRYEEAITAYRSAIRHRPDITQYHDNLGTLLSNLKRYDEALEVFKQGLAANPGYPIIHRNLGYTYANMGKLSQAEEHLRLYLEQSAESEDREEVLKILQTLKRMRLQETIP